MTKEQLMEKKKKLKEKFDMEYDNGEAEETYFDELKIEAGKQAEVSSLFAVTLLNYYL